MRRVGSKLHKSQSSENTTRSNQCWDVDLPLFQVALGPFQLTDGSNGIVRVDSAGRLLSWGGSVVASRFPLEHLRKHLQLVRQPQSLSYLQGSVDFQVETKTKSSPQELGEVTRCASTMGLEQTRTCCAQRVTRRCSVESIPEVDTYQTMHFA